MDSSLEYMPSGARGLLWPCLIVPGAQATASRSLETDNAYPLLRAPERVWPEARVSPQVKEGGGMIRLVAKSYLLAPIIWWKNRKHELLQGLVLFRLVVRPF
jgi:hypothetical protein